MICRVFYSWQSDLPNKTNRGFIEKALENAAKSIRNDGSIKVEPVVDRDTTGVPGAPDIAQTILHKIDQSDVFVCDVSIIDKLWSRPTPNPNVLIELGYALKTLGSSRVILVMNTYFGNPELLPFDLRMKRVLAYFMSPDEEDRATERKKLTTVLDSGLRDIVVDIENQITKSEASQISIDTKPQVLWDESWTTKHQAIAKQNLVQTGFTGFFESKFALMDPNIHLWQKQLLNAVGRTQIHARMWGWPIVSVNDDPSGKPRPTADGIASESIRKDIPWTTEPLDIYEYWAIKNGGDFYLLRSLDEDIGKQNRGKSIFFDTRIMRIAEILTYCSRLYSILGVEPTTLINIWIKHSGLKERKLIGSKPDTTFLLISSNIPTSIEDKQEMVVQVKLSSIETNLNDLVKQFVQPLFMLFDFHEFHDSTYQKYVNEWLIKLK